jgi:hypothetical protein
MAITGMTGAPYSAARLGQGTAQVRARRSSFLAIGARQALSWGAFANMAPILLFAVSLEDRRSRQGVFALSALISLQPYALRCDSYHRSKARVHVAKVVDIIIELNLDNALPILGWGIFTNLYSTSGDAARLDRTQRLSNASRFQDLHLLFDERAELCLMQPFQRTCNAPLVSSGGD